MPLVTQSGAPLPPPAAVRSGCYVLQNVVPSLIGDDPFQVNVVEPTSDGANTWFTSSDVRLMRSKGPSDKIVVGYFSLGEAESYRDYWAAVQSAGIIGPADRDWPGDYQVAFWTSTWRSVCFDYCSSMVRLGYDGVYFDVVDEWGLAWAQVHVPGGGARNSANAMITLIHQIRSFAKALNPNFQIWVNGGDELFAYSPASYVNSFDGMFKEQVLYRNPSAGKFITNPTAARLYEAQVLQTATNAGKPVILVEYVTGSEAIGDVKAECAAWGFGYYIANPDLSLNGIDYEGAP
jgi:cysteinyl-tRNA synthetase